MGCCESKVSENQQPEKIQTQHLAHNSRTTTHHTNPTSESDPETGGAPSFSEFSFADLKVATNNFSSDYIVSESGEKAPNLVYKGRLQNRRWIAVKKFTKMAWPDRRHIFRSVLDQAVCGGSFGCGEATASAACEFDTPKISLVTYSHLLQDNIARRALVRTESSSIV